MESIKISEEWRRRQCPKGEVHGGSNGRREALGWSGWAAQTRAPLLPPVRVLLYTGHRLHSCHAIATLGLLNSHFFLLVRPSGNLMPRKSDLAQLSAAWGQEELQRHVQKMQVLHLQWKSRTDRWADTEHLNCSHPNKRPPQKIIS